MKRVALAIAGAIAAILAAAFVIPTIFVIGFIWEEWDWPSCNEDSPAVAYARSLSQERLARLYRDMDSYAARNDELLEWSISNKGVEVPKEFSDLKVLRIRPNEGNIMVHGCFDSYVYLTFEGVGWQKGSGNGRRITLSWGERPPEAGEQVLWADAVKP